MVLVEAICEHIFHEEVDFINRVELLDVFAELVLGNPSKISVSGLPDVKVFVNVIKLSLVPSVLNVPI